MWFEIKNQQVTLRIFAKPQAKRTAILKIEEKEIHISLRAQPHEGKANNELVSYLAKLFRLPKSEIVLKRGESARHKVIQVPLVSSVQQFIDNSICENESRGQVSPCGSTIAPQGDT